MAMADITRLVSTRPSAQRVGVVFVAEGAAGLGAEQIPGRCGFRYMFSVSGNMSRLNAPFSAFENYFNVSALFVAHRRSR